MLSIIRQIINYTASSGYNTTNPDPYYLACSVGLILILTIVTCDWLRQIYRSLINKIR